MKGMYRFLMVGLLFCGQHAFGMLAAMKAAGADKTSDTSDAAKAPKSDPMMDAMKKSSDKKDDTPKSTTSKTEADAKKTSDSKDKKEDEPKKSTDSSSSESTGKVQLEVTDVHSSGLDTINIDSSGNWLEKRIWFKKGEDLFDEIRTIVKKASDIRMEFVHEVNTIGKKIDEFYEHVNFEKGQVDQMLKDILDEIDQESSMRGGDLSSKERSLKLSVKNEQKQIETIGNDIKKVDDFDNQIDKTMMQAFKIIEECRTLETKAWDNFKAIGAELDDKKARTLYYEIDNAHKNIEQKIKHLQSTLLPYLKSKLIAPAEQAMTKVQSAVKSLDEKGIHLESLIKGDQKDDLKTVKEREQEAEKEAEDKWEKHQKEEIDKKQKESHELEAKAKSADTEHHLDKKKKDEGAPWYHKFVCMVWCHITGALYWLWGKIYQVFHHGTSALCQKLMDVAPSFWDHLITFLHCVYCKLLSFLFIVLEQIKCFICHIWAWLSGFFK